MTLKRKSYFVLNFVS